VNYTPCTGKHCATRWYSTGYSDVAPSALRRDRLDSAPTRERRKLCLHVLSSFQRTGRIVLPTLRPPPRLSPWGEPSNLTRRFQLLSTPGRAACRSFFGMPTSLPEKRGAEERLGLNLRMTFVEKKLPRSEHPKQIIRPPGRVTLGSLNIRGGSESVNPSTTVRRTNTRTAEVLLSRARRCQRVRADLTGPSRSKWSGGDLDEPVRGGRLDEARDVRVDEGAATRRRARTRQWIEGSPARRNGSRRAALTGKYVYRPWLCPSRRCHQLRTDPVRIGHRHGERRGSWAHCLGFNQCRVREVRVADHNLEGSGRSGSADGCWYVL